MKERKRISSALAFLLAAVMTIGTVIPCLMVHAETEEAEAATEWITTEFDDCAASCKGTDNCVASCKGAEQEAEPQGSVIYQLMSEDSDEVPAGSLMVWNLEKYENGEWIPAEDVVYQIFDDEGAVWDEYLMTGEDGLISLYKTEHGYPFVEFNEIQVSLQDATQSLRFTSPNECWDRDAAQSLAPTAEEDEYRLTINEEETEEAWGVPVGLSVYSPISDEDDRAANPKDSVLYPDYSEDAENATAFVNFLDTSSYEEEEETEVEETEAPSPTEESEEVIDRAASRREISDSTELSSVSETDTPTEQEEEEQASLNSSEEEMPEEETSEEETTEEETTEEETAEGDNQDSMEEPEIAEYAVEAVTDGSVYYLSDTTPVYQSIGWGSMKTDLSPGDTEITLKVNGSSVSFAKGIGAHAESTLIYDVRPLYEEGYDCFQTYYGLSTSATSGNVKFYMYTTTDEEYATATWTEVEDVDHSAKSGSSNAGFVEIPLTEDMTYLKLYADPNGGNGSDHSCYGDAKYIKSDLYYDDLISRVEVYDEKLKEYYAEYGTDIASHPEYEDTLLKRELVYRAGYYELQSLFKEEDGEDIKEMLAWMFDETDFFKLYLTGGSIGPNYRTGAYSYSGSSNDSVVSSLEVMRQLWEAHPEGFVDHSNNNMRPKMIISLSLTLTGNVKFWFGTGGSGTADKSITHPDPVERYEIFLDLYVDGLLTDYFEDLQVPEMRYIMASPIHNNELRWASEMARDNNYNTNCYFWMYYQYGTYNYFDDKYYDDSTWGSSPKYNYVEKYNLNQYGITNYGYGDTTMVKYPMNWITMVEGGVCWNIANICQNIWSSYGRPCYICGCWGGSHEVYMAYNRLTDSDGNEYGRWSIENGLGVSWADTHYGAYDSTGWHIARMIGDWGMGSDFEFNNASYIVLGQSAMNDFDNYVVAEEIEMLSRVFEDDEQTLESLYWEMLDVQGFHFDAWYGLTKLYAASDSKSDSDKHELVQKMVAEDALMYYPLAENDLIKLLLKTVDTTLYTTMITNTETASLNQALVCTDDDFYHSYSTRDMAKNLLGKVDSTVATFSFDGEDAGKIMLDEEKFPHAEYWEYSLDGGETWSAIIHDEEVQDAEGVETLGISTYNQIVVSNPNVVQLTEEEIEQINADDNILIRFIQVPDYWYTLNIEESSAPVKGDTTNVTGVYLNPWENEGVYVSDTMEWRNAGTDDEWTLFREKQPDRDENTSVEIRESAHENYTAGPSVTLSYESDAYTPSEKYSYIKKGRTNIYACTSQTSSTRASKYANDGSVYSFYQTGTSSNYPQYMTIELDRMSYVSGVDYQCNLGNTANGQIRSARVLTSLDGETWTEVSYLDESDGYSGEGEALAWGGGNSASGKAAKKARFVPVKAKYVRLESYSSTSNFTSIADIRLYENTEGLVDKTELDALISEIEALNLAEEDYSAASWHTLRKALSYAKEVQDEADVSEEEVEDAVKELREALDGLTTARSVSGTITWNDSGDQDGKRPSYVALHVFADGTEIRTENVYAESGNTWHYAISDLPVGEEAEITVEADDVEGYSRAVDGTNLTFSHTTETVYITVKITWDDDDDAAGARPDTIRCHLLADGEKSDSANLTYANCQWNYTGFAVRPKYSGGSEINYSVILDSQTNPARDYTAVYTGSGTNFEIILTYNPGKTNVSVTKTWNDADNQDGIRPDSITVSLLNDGSETGKTLEIFADNNWMGSFTDLDAGGDYTVREADVDGYSSKSSYSVSYGHIVANSHTPETVSVTGSVLWDDDSDERRMRPYEVRVVLLADGVETASTSVSGSSSSFSWNYSFTDLPKYSHGTEIVYTVVQDAVSDYQTTYEGNNVSNTYVPGETSVNVSLHWEDNNNQDGLRPVSVIVRLYRNGTDTGHSVTLSEVNGWTDSFTGLASETEGEWNEYTVVPENVPGYESSTAGTQSSGYRITNVHEPETISVSGTKTWKDEGYEEERPESITVTLYADGLPVSVEADEDRKGTRSLTVSEADGWAYDFGDLDKYADGEEIVYTIVEDALTDYSVSYDGFDITNTYAKGTTSVTVFKTWDDAGNQDGIRPEEVSVRLYRDGEETEQTLTLSETNGWVGSFTSLPAMDGTRPVSYTVKEDVPDGYKSEISGDAETGFQIVNTHEPETISVYGYKEWNDDNNASGTRPDEIVVRLYADGTEVRVSDVIITGCSAIVQTSFLQKLANFFSNHENGTWYWEFNDLPKYSNGTEIVYTVAESPIEGYVSETDGYDIINTYEEDHVSLPVSIVWSDLDNSEGLRPESLTLTLFSDGEELMELVLSAEEGWTGFFPDVPIHNEAGEKIAYEVSVSETVGYASSVARNEDGSFTVSMTSETIADDIVAAIHGVGYPSLQAAFDAASEGDTVVLVKDIELTETAVVSGSVVLDLNNHSIDGECLLISVEGSLTVENDGAIRSTGDAAIAVSGGVCSLDAGSYIGDETAVYVETGTLVINGGDFRVINEDASLLIDCEDPAYDAGSASVSVTGGLFYGWDPSHTQSERYSTSFTADGYFSEEVEENVFEVKSEDAGTDGHKSEEPDETEPDETEPDETEPDETEPDETEPDETKPDETEPDETEPDETEPDETEPDETEPDETEPDETEPDETEPDETEPDETEPDETEPDETEPDETEPETLDIHVSLSWEDGGQHAAESIEIAITDSEGGIIATAILSAENGWGYTFEGLPDGDYSLMILTEGYEGHFSGDAQHGFAVLVEEAHTEHTEFSVSVSWNDTVSHPDFITARLLNEEDEIVASVILNADNNWNARFTDLPDGEYHMTAEAEGYDIVVLWDENTNGFILIPSLYEGEKETEPDEEESDGTEDNKSEPDETESDETEDNESEPEETESDEAKLDETENDGTEPDETEADGAEDNESEPDETEAEETEDDETEPNSSDKDREEAEAIAGNDNDAISDGQKSNESLTEPENRRETSPGENSSQDATKRSAAESKASSEGQDPSDDASDASAAGTVSLLNSLKTGARDNLAFLASLLLTVLVGLGIALINKGKEKGIIKD